MSKIFLFNDLTLQKIIRYWLAGFLLFLPFQGRVTKMIASRSNELSLSISYLDEASTVLIFLIAAREYYKNRYDKLFYIVIPILIFIFVGLISGIANRNLMYVTVLGTFDYVKNILVIFIYAAFFRNINQLKSVFRLVLIVAVFLGLIGFMQEIVALINRYILDKSFSEMGEIWFIGKARITDQSWRLGVLLVRSLTRNSILFGLYSLLILTLYLSIVKKVNLAIFSLLFAGVLFCASRVVYAGYIVLAGIQTLKKKQWGIAFTGILIAIGLTFLSSLPDFNVWELSFSLKNKVLSSVEPIKIDDDSLNIKKEIPDEDTPAFRKYTRRKGLEIWRDYPMLGIGPGKFGAIISIKTHSFIYGEYNFSAIVKHYMKSWSGIDQFWPQVLAETGIIGTAAFAGILISLFLIFYISGRKALSDEMRGLFNGLATFTVIIIIYSMGSGLNLTPVLFTYSAFAGMGLGCES